MNFRTGKIKLRKIWMALLAVLITLTTIPAGMFMTTSPVYADTIHVTLQKGSTAYKYGGTGLAYHYTVTVNGKTRQAYCLQPSEMPPEVGNRTAAQMPDSSKVARTMYYCYGYPGQGKLSNWLKTHGHSSYASGMNFYVFCHVLLSYQYQPKTAFVGWTGPNPNTTINKSYQDMVKAAAKYVNTLPDPAGFDSSISFSSTNGSSASAKWNGSGFKSDEITLKGHEDNYVEYKVPSGMTLTMGGRTYKAGANVVIHSGIPFTLSTTDKSKAGTTYSSGTLHGNLQDYTAYKITGSGTQNMAFFAVDKSDTASFSVKFGKIPPTIGTKAYSLKTMSSQGTVGSDEKIVDTVSYSNLEKGKEYTVKGILMDKDTGKPLEIDGKQITAEKTFTADKADGTIEIEFSLDASKLAGRTTVVFEDLFMGETKVASHAEISDEGQSIHYPEVGTSAEDSETKSHQGVIGKSVKIIDTVSYNNLIPGREYTVKGTLMNKDTGKALTVDGKQITAETTFTAAGAAGTVDLEYTLDSTLLEGKTTVVFEDLYYGQVKVASHADISDEEQTVHYPDVKTSAKDAETKSSQGVPGKTEKIVDTVSYRNLIPGKEYTVKGVLMDKEIGKPFEKDGKQVTAEKKFTPEKADGTVDIEFTIDSSDLAGKSTVVFEDLYEGEVKIASHADITDEGQTIRYPSIRTKAADGVTGSHQGTIGKKQTIVDTVTYKNLVPGETYTLKGRLIDKSSGKAVTNNGKAVTAETTFKPVTSNGEVKVKFTLDTTDLEKHKIVVFEDLEHNGVNVASHSDINDEGQSITYPEKPVTPEAPPKTGDMTSIAIPIAAGAAAAAALIWMIIRRRHRKNGGEIDE
jgi:LPXTG-motif cell wall-anchored protein